MSDATEALHETVTLSQAKQLIRCLAHEQSLLLLSPPGRGQVGRGPPGGGRVAPALQIAAGHADRAGRRQRRAAHRRRALGVLPAARAVAGERGSVLPVSRRAAGLHAGRAEGVLFAAAGAPARRARPAGGDVGGRGRQPGRGPRPGPHHLQRAGQPCPHPAHPHRRGGVDRLGAGQRRAGRGDRFRRGPAGGAAAAGAA